VLLATSPYHQHCLNKDHRRQGIGEALLISLIEMAIAKKARIITLEARV